MGPGRPGAVSKRNFSLVRVVPAAIIGTPPHVSCRSIVELKPTVFTLQVGLLPSENCSALDGLFFLQIKSDDDDDDDEIMMMTKMLTMMATQIMMMTTRRIW